MSTSAPPRQHVLSDEQWERIEPLLPSNAGRRGHPFGDNRMIVEGIVYRHRRGFRGGTCPGSGSARGRQCGSATISTPDSECGTESMTS